MAATETYGIVGATSLVGAPLLQLLARSGKRTVAYSRTPPSGIPGWRSYADPPVALDTWIGTAPIWTLPEHFALLEASGARRLVQLSSTSRFTKTASSDPRETGTAHRLADAEAQLIAWAEAHGVAWTILRPTLIHGFGRDRNVAEIVRFIERFGFFPLLGRAEGLRQPVAAEDVARACMLAAASEATRGHVYDIGGGETLGYREMVLRIFEAMHRRPVTPTVPLWAFRLALAALRAVPRYRHWTPAMAERMNVDMVFDNGPAHRDFGYAPKWFEPDVPSLAPRR